MDKEFADFIKNSYKGAIQKYENATREIGLWQSEQYIFNKYFKKEDRILDIGCGTGRTSFGLYILGYKKITGLDLSKEMLNKARKINKKLNFNIDFIEGNALDMNFAEETFDKALFSFNGLMQIPRRENRLEALKEIKRILKQDGIFVFTTHNRNRGEEFQDYWEKEREKWEKGIQDNRLFEYGDRITTTKNNKEELFIHIPTHKEVLHLIKEAGFTLIEDFFRPDRFEESKKVKEFSGDCQFWVVEK